MTCEKNGQYLHDSEEVLESEVFQLGHHRRLLGGDEMKGHDTFLYRKKAFP